MNNRTPPAAKKTRTLAAKSLTAAATRTRKARASTGKPGAGVTPAAGKPSARQPKKRAASAHTIARLSPLPAKASVKSGALVPQDGAREGLDGPDPALMNGQSKVWNLLMDYYFRLDIAGWDKLPDRPSLLIGVHSGGTLTMDAWTVAIAWWRHFQGRRNLHGTAHDVLMNNRILGRYFRRMGVVSPSRETLSAAFEKGDDVILWPGGEIDAFRSWTQRDKAVLGDRKGFIRLAIRCGVPIVPVATVGGHDTLFVLSEGRGIARFFKLKERMRSEVAPITLSLPFGIGLHVLPIQHIPLPAKIRTRFLEPVLLDTDRARADDNDYVDAVFADIAARIQAGMDELAAQRRFPIFG